MGAANSQGNQETGNKCRNCGKESLLISKALGLCLDCIRNDFDRVLPLIEQAHSAARTPFELPERVPRDESGAECKLCINECRIPPGGRSYCGLRVNTGNRLVGAAARQGNVSWDSHPL